LLPFVKVKVCPLRDAVINARLADVFKLLIEVAWDAVVEFKLLIDIFTLADVISKLFSLIFADAVNVFKLSIDVIILAVD
jgi:hypothetical protein